MNLDGKLWRGGRSSDRQQVWGGPSGPSGQAHLLRLWVLNQGLHSRDSWGDHAEAKGHGVQPQHLLPEVVQPGVDGGVRPAGKAWARAEGTLLTAGPQEAPCPHSPQLMLVVTQAHGQEGSAPELQQPAVQLLGHKIEPVWRGRLPWPPGWGQVCGQQGLWCPVT